MVATNESRRQAGDPLFDLSDYRSVPTAAGYYPAATDGDHRRRRVIAIRVFVPFRLMGTRSIRRGLIIGACVLLRRAVINGRTIFRRVYRGFPCVTVPTDRAGEFPRNA